jgi:hypothetical protein
MDGYRYLVERNRLMFEFEDQAAKLKHLPLSERQAKIAGMQVELDRKIAALYAQVADEFPGERIKKARPISDPR